jgi:type I restriction enzyme, S subunit
VSKRDQEQMELLEEGEAVSNDAVTPRGWATLRLSEIAEVRLGRQRSPERATGDHMRPYMRAANITWSGISLHDVKQMDFTPREAETYQLRHGDILLGEASGSANEVGKPAIWRDEVPGACFQNTLIRIRAPQELVEFLYYHFLRDAMTGRFAKASRGVGIHHLGAQSLSDWEVVVPPRAEQERIVSTIETQFSRLDAAEAGLRRVQANLKRYRAAVLQAAVEGRLVPTEAELARREGRDYEPAVALLDRILAERRRRWEEAELARLTARGKPPQNDAWKAKYQEPAAPDPSNLPSLPEGWCWTTIDQLAADERNSLTDGPFGSNLKTEHYTAAGPRVIRLQNIGDAVFVDERAHISEEHYSSLIKHAVFPGDIVIASLGTELPRACEVPDWLGHAIVKADCIRFCPDPGLASKTYLTYALNAHPTRQRTMSIVHGIGRPRIGLTLLRQIPIPLPPLGEQKRMTNEIDRLVSIANEIQVTVDGDIVRCQRLRQAILKQAFQGKLVAQDPGDEPASALLARIRGEHSAPAPSMTTTTSGSAGSASSARPARKRARP